jgi:hypothetical protein
MNKTDILTNEFTVKFDLETENLLISTIHQGKLDPPIRLRLDVLTEMGASNASKWVGETILLLIPEVRKKLFQLDEEK